jgi:hypothetical protein
VFERRLARVPLGHQLHDGEHLFHPERHGTPIRADRGTDFLEKAGRVPDLYQRLWENKLLEPGDTILSADAKSAIQARKRILRTKPRRCRSRPAI